MVNWLQLRYDIKVRVVRLDSEMDRIKTKRWLNGKDIDFERCILNTYKQNGITETVGKSIIAKAKAIRLSSWLFHTLWKKIIVTIVYLYNRTL